MIYSNLLVRAAILPSLILEDARTQLPAEETVTVSSVRGAEILRLAPADIRAALDTPALQALRTPPLPLVLIGHAASPTPY